MSVTSGQFQSTRESCWGLHKKVSSRRNQPYVDRYSESAHTSGHEAEHKGDTVQRLPDQTGISQRSE